jgi:hypothetical protein
MGKNQLFLQKITFIINLLVVCIISFCLFYRIFLPFSYIIGAGVFGIVLALSIVKNGFNSKFVFFQILLVFFLLRNVYYLSTRNVIPFGDAYWDYAVEKIFLENGNVETIQAVVRPTEAGGISQLTWYSGWPILHIFGIIFSLFSGIDLLYLNWFLPNFLGLVTFAFIYLIIEKIRVKLKISKMITVIALLLYALSPEAIFWQMQYVRQSIALALIAPIIYFVYLINFEKFDRKYFMILIILIITLAMSHHVTAFTVTLFLFLFSAIDIIVGLFGRWKKFGTIFSRVGGVWFQIFGWISFLFIFLWWNRNATIIFPTISSRLIGFFENLGIERIYTQAVVSYPEVLKPDWVTPLLGLRDLLIFIPAAIGLLIFWRKRYGVRQKFFLIYSIVGFGFVLVINIVFKIEPLRILLFMMPFLVFLSAFFYIKTQVYIKIRNTMVKFNKIIIFVVTILLVFSSFLGLWAHNFAPVHLYDSSVDPGDIGEGTPDFIRLKPFFEDHLNISNFEDVRADVIGRLVYLLDPKDFDKIKSFPVENLELLDNKNTLVCSFNDLNLYLYYGNIWSPIKATEIELVKLELQKHLESNFNQIYNDGSNSLWISSS